MTDSHIQIDPTANVSPTARFDVGDGGSVTIGPNCEIRHGAHFEVYDEGRVTIAARAVIGVNNWIQGNGDVTIGPDTILGPNVVLTSTSHQTDLSLPIQQQPLSKRPITIGRDVWIGANATILAGVQIGDQAVIGANSLVNRDVSPASIVAGCPARFINLRRATPTRRTILFAIALGITDRPERWTTITKFFVTLGNTLREDGVDSWYACHSAAAKPLERIRKDRRFVAADHAGFEELLDRSQPDLIFIWNGGSEGDVITKQIADTRGIPCRFGELGWFPQSETLYFDTEGTNARSSIRKLNLSKHPADPRIDGWLRDWRARQTAPRPGIDGYVFVPLQDERDLNITLASPYKTMDAFVSALALRFPDQHFIVRPHPHFPDVRIANHPNVTIRADGPLHAWLNHADAVVGINSTVLLESLAWGRPTHAVGVGLATGLHIMYDAEGVDSLKIRRDIDGDRWERTRRFLSELVFARQIQRKDLHYLKRLRSAYGVADLLRDSRIDTSQAAHLQDCALSTT